MTWRNYGVFNRETNPVPRPYRVYDLDDPGWHGRQYATIARTTAQGLSPVIGALFGGVGNVASWAIDTYLGAQADSSD
jgi:hypothetical protein